MHKLVTFAIFLYSYNAVTFFFKNNVRHLFEFILCVKVWRILAGIADTNGQQHYCH